jgi:predicted phosphodiesterase
MGINHASEYDTAYRGREFVKLNVMNLAIFSDMHGNLPAFEAVLEDCKHLGISRFLCLGDAANFGPQPKETLECLRILGCPVVMGNTDATLLKPRTLADIQEPNENTEYLLAVENWCAAQLDEHGREFVRTFQPTVMLELDALKLLAYHGSPKSYYDPIVATTPEETLDGYFETTAVNLYAGGHTHEQFVRRYTQSRVMNPGSVGLPYVFKKDGTEMRPVFAEYAVLGTAPEVNINFRRVPYSFEKLATAVRESKMPYAEKWLAEFELAPEK